MVDNIHQALRDIGEKVSHISPEVIATLPKNGQTLLLSFLDPACLPEDIRRRNSLFCSEVFNVHSGKNLDDQDENVLALWMIGTLLGELFDGDKAADAVWFIAQKEKIVDLFEKEPFFAKAVVVPEPVVETIVETVVLPTEVSPEKSVIPTTIDVSVEPSAAPPLLKESITARLQKARAEIAEKAKSLDIQKLKSVLTEKVSALHLKENIAEKVAKMKGWFRKK